VNITNRLQQPSHLEDEDFDDERRLDDSQSDGDNSEKEPQVSSRRSRRNWQENFQCTEKHDGSNAEADRNPRTIEKGEQMCYYYDRINDHWRSVAYRREASTLRKQKIKLTAKVNNHTKLTLASFRRLSDADASRGGTTT